MKNFKLFIFSALIASSQTYTIDIPTMFESCGKQIETYRDNLLRDSTTQGGTLASIVTGVCCYKYYHYNAALVCLDEHPNSRIMHKSNLIYLTYSDFLDKIESMNSYAAVVEFIEQYCTDCCYAISDAKINKFIAFVDDLQRNNNKQINSNIEKENIILENFKNQLILAQANIKQELINGAINANKNANNAYTLTKVVEIISAILGAFNKK